MRNQPPKDEIVKKKNNRYSVFNMIKMQENRRRGNMIITLFRSFIIAGLVVILGYFIMSGAFNQKDFLYKYIKWGAESASKIANFVEGIFDQEYVEVTEDGVYIKK